MALPKPSGDFEWVQESWGAALRCASLAAIAPHCFSTRALVLEGAPDEDHESWKALAGWRATRDQLVRAGVPTRQIQVCELCTFDHATLFHSYRRDRQRAGRLVAGIRSRG